MSTNRITAADAREISSLARRQRMEEDEMRERHFRERLEVDFLRREIEQQVAEAIRNAGL